MRVAAFFRRPDVDAFLGELSAAEFSEWAEFFREEPAGYRAVGEQTARLTAALFNSRPFRGADAEWVDYRVLLPWHEPEPEAKKTPPPPADPGAARAAALAMAKVFGADVYDAAGNLVESHAGG